jgi:Flp pilus assembly protein TadG
VRSEAGTSAVEFALVASLLFILVLGTFELGLGLYYGLSLRWALETGARNLLITPTTTQAQLESAVRSRLSDIPNGNSVAVSLTLDSSNPAAKVYVATASYTYPMAVPMLPAYNLQFNSRVAVPTV